MQIQTAINQCLAEIEATKSPLTAKSYKNGLSCFLDFLVLETGLKPGSSVEKLDVNIFIRFPSYLLRQRYANSTHRVYLAAAKAFLEWIVIQGQIIPTYEEALRLNRATSGTRRKRGQRLPKTPEKGAVEKIVQAVNKIKLDKPFNQRAKALILFLYSSGCRNGEAVRLRVSDLNLKDQRAIIIGKGDREDYLYFSKKTATAIRSYWRIRGFEEPSNPVFMRHDKRAAGQPLPISSDTVRAIVDHVATLAGFDKGEFTPHTFRHAFAIRVLQETGDLAITQDLMRHQSPLTTRIYAKIYDEEKKATHKRIFDQ